MDQGGCTEVTVSQEEGRRLKGLVVPSCPTSFRAPLSLGVLHRKPQVPQQRLLEEVSEASFRSGKVSLAAASSLVSLQGAPGEKCLQKVPVFPLGTLQGVCWGPTLVRPGCTVIVLPRPCVLCWLPLQLRALTRQVWEHLRLTSASCSPSPHSPQGTTEMGACLLLHPLLRRREVGEHPKTHSRAAQC